MCLFLFLSWIIYVFPEEWFTLQNQVEQRDATFSENLFHFHTHLKTHSCTITWSEHISLCYGFFSSSKPWWEWIHLRNI